MFNQKKNPYEHPMMEFLDLQVVYGDEPDGSGLDKKDENGHVTPSDPE